MSTTTSAGTASANGTVAPTPPQTITFNEIPFDIQVPGTYVEVKANYSQAGLLAYPAKALIIAQMQSNGTAVPNTPYPVFATAEGSALFGSTSIAFDMIAAFIKANPWTQLDVIGVPDAAGATKATNTVTITGAATSAGSLMVYVAAMRLQVPVSAGDTASVVAANVVTAWVNALVAGVNLPVSITAAAGVLTLTANHGGTLGNTIDVRLNAQPGDQTPAGLQIAVTGFTGGATDPDITDALNAIASTWYTDIIVCWNDTNNVGLLEAALATRYTAMGKLDAHAYRAITGTPGTVQSAQANYNCKFASTLPVQNPLDPTWRWAASFGGVCSYYLAQDPSRQLRTLSLPGITAPAAADQYTETERNILLAGGMSTFTVGVDGTVMLERVVTEYRTSASGVLDPSWHDIMTPKTASRVRYDWIGYLSLTYPRNKLADDGTLAAEYDTTVVTPSRVQASWAGRSRLYGELGWIENVSQTAKQSVFVRDQTNPNRLNARMQIQIIGNLMIFAGSLEFSL